MAIGERIRHIRGLRGLTLKFLGKAAGFPEKTADIRMSQYEKGTRTPKEDLTQRLAEVLEVSPRALAVPDIDTPEGLMHTLFALEDLYGLTIGEFEGRTCLYLNREAPEWFREALSTWKKEGKMFHNDEITRDEYNTWRYNYPEYIDKPVPYAIKPEEIHAREAKILAEGGVYARVSSKEFSNALIESMKKDGLL